MGQRLTRPFRNFNVENRAAKVLENQQKAPKAAPKHAGTLDALSQMKEDGSEILSEMEIRNQKLHENLKQIYIDSKDPPIQIKSALQSPQLARQATGDLDLGVMDTDTNVPVGRSTLRSIMGFMAGHQENPAQHLPAAIAEQHKLDEAAVSNVLAHFKVMQLHIPKEMYKETKSMSKVMAEQLKISQNVASSFRLEAQEKAKRIPGNNTADSKT